jgi:hypothetical protein
MHGTNTKLCVYRFCGAFVALFLGRKTRATNGQSLKESGCVRSCAEYCNGLLEKERMGGERERERERERKEGIITLRKS